MSLTAKPYAILFRDAGAPDVWRFHSQTYRTLEEAENTSHSLHGAEFRIVQCFSRGYLETSLMWVRQA